MHSRVLCGTRLKQCPLNSKHPFFRLSPYDPKTALAFNFIVMFSRGSTPSFGILLYCLLSFKRDLSRSSSSGLRLKKPRNALSPEYDHPGAYLLLQRRDIIAVSFYRIPRLLQKDIGLSVASKGSLSQRHFQFQLQSMVEEASFHLFDILDFGAGIDVRNLHLNPVDEVADKPPGTKNLFEVRNLAALCPPPLVCSPPVWAFVSGVSSWPEHPPTSLPQRRLAASSSPSSFLPSQLGLQSTLQAVSASTGQTSPRVKGLSGSSLP